MQPAQILWINGLLETFLLEIRFSSLIMLIIEIKIWIRKLVLEQRLRLVQLRCKLYTMKLFPHFQNSVTTKKMTHRYQLVTSMPLLYLHHSMLMEQEMQILQYALLQLLLRKVDAFQTLSSFQIHIHYQLLHQSHQLQSQIHLDRLQLNQVAKEFLSELL